MNLANYVIVIWNQASRMTISSTNQFLSNADTYIDMLPFAKSSYHGKFVIHVDNHNSKTFGYVEILIYYGLGMICIM